MLTVLAKKGREARYAHWKQREREVAERTEGADQGSERSAHRAQCTGAGRADNKLE